MGTQIIGYSEFLPGINPLIAAQRCQKLGLTALQIAGDYPVNFPENVNMPQRKQLKDFAGTAGISLHFHAPTDIPLASRHEKLRLGALERLKEYIALAMDINAKSFVFHPGRFAFYKISSGRVVFADKNVPEPYFERFYESILKLCEFADSNLLLLLENTHNFSERVIEVIDKFLEKPSAGLVWDIAHMKLNGSRSEKEKKHNAEFFTERLKSIKLMHIHDVRNGKSHQPLGSGGIDFKPYISLGDELKIPIIIEVFSNDDLMRSLEYIKSIK
jgi:sugar phosphate isomerase/epimerase